MGSWQGRWVRVGGVLAGEMGEGGWGPGRGDE